MHQHGIKARGKRKFHLLFGFEGGDARCGCERKPAHAVAPVERALKGGG